MKFIQRFIVLFVLCFSIATAAEAKEQLPSVAILYFNYEGQDAQLQVLKKGLAQMLISHVQPGVPSVKIVERERLEDILKELELGSSGKIDPDTAAKVGKLIGARYLVVGSYFDLFGSLRIDSRLLNVETGEIIGSVGANGAMADFFALEGIVVDGLQKELLKLEPIDVSATKSIPAKKSPSKPAKSSTPSKSSSPPKKVTTATIVTYSKALDAKDKNDTEAVKKELSNIDAEVAVLLDLDSLLQ